jgi:polyisoprenoid-binding protein YceI
MSTPPATQDPTSAHDLSSAAALPPGSYRLDPAASTVTFTTRAMFGLMKVRGSFGRLGGTLEVAADGSTTGALHIEVETIDTGIPKRDAHLNRSDFFHTGEHPEATFTLTALDAAGSSVPTARGTLRIRDAAIPVEAPVTLAASGSRVRADAAVQIDHHAAGLPFRKPLLISGRAQVRASLVFAAA